MVIWLTKWVRPSSLPLTFCEDTTQWRDVGGATGRKPRYRISAKLGNADHASAAPPRRKWRHPPARPRRHQHKRAADEDPRSHRNAPKENKKKRTKYPRRSSSIPSISVLWIQFGRWLGFFVLGNARYLAVIISLQN